MSGSKKSRILYDSRQPINRDPDFGAYEVLPPTTSAQDPSNRVTYMIAPGVTVKGRIVSADSPGQAPAKTPIVTAADFGQQLDPSALTFTPFASAPTKMRTEFRILAQSKLLCFPAFAAPLDPATCIRGLGMSRDRREQHHWVKPPFGTWLITVTLPNSGGTHVIGACQLSCQSFAFRLEGDVPNDEPLQETDLDCHGFWNFPAILQDVLEIGALKPILNFLHEQSKPLCKQHHGPVRLATVATHAPFARLLQQEHRFDYENPGKIKAYKVRVPGTVAPREEENFDNHVLYRTVKLP